jgi:hypothetical protein
MKPDEELTFNEYWNEQFHVVWFDEFQDEPVISEVHGLAYIPIIVQLIEGSELFQEDDQETRQPFLYTVWKSKLINRLTLNLTTLYTNIYAVAANPMFTYTRNGVDKQLLMDFSVPGGVTYIDQGEKLEPTIKNAVDPAFLEGMKIAEQKFTESTIYKTSFGESVGANAAYSMVALLHQSGRLPLAPYRELLSFAYADAMKLGIEMLMEKGSKRYKASGQDGQIEIDLNKIPRTYELQTLVELDLPQDERQNVVMAVQATYGPDPLVSKYTARKNWLGMKQPDLEDNLIFGEKMSGIMMQQYLQQMMMQQQQQQMMQQQMAAGAMSGMPPEGGMMGGGGMEGGGLPPEVMNQLQNMQQAGVAGSPMIGPQQSLGTMPNMDGGQMPVIAPEGSENRIRE